MKIRPYTKKDWKSILEIYNLAKPDELKGSVKPEDIVGLEDDERLLNSFNNSDIFVLEDVDIIKGFAGKENNLISFLFVHPDYYRKGFGKKLLAFILDKMDEKAWLIVAQSNVNAISLYSKFNFKIAEAFSGMYNNKIKVNIYRLALKPELESWEL